MSRVNKLWLTLVVLIIFVLVSGCTMFTEYVDKPYPVYHQINCPVPPKQRGVLTSMVHPRVIRDAQGVSWVGFTPKHYENLSTITKDTIRYIKGKNGEVTYYRKCIDQFNESIVEKKRPP